MYNYFPTPCWPCMQCMCMGARSLYWQDTTYNPTTQLTENIRNESENNIIADTRENIENVDTEISSEGNISDLNTSSLKPEDDVIRDNENVDNILSRIEKEDPMITRTLTSYGVPDNITAELIKRIIPLTS